jgi:hypothetical protein
MSIQSKYVVFICTISVSLQPKVVYKPTEYPYSRCFEHGTDRVTCEKLNMSKGMNIFFCYSMIYTEKHVCIYIKLIRN